MSLFAIPAIWINVSCGQNGALTLAILTGGCLLLDRRPVIAGLILGLLVIKPQLAVVLPFALAASALSTPQHWKTFFATGFSALAICVLAYGLVGQAGYAAFLHNSAFARDTLNDGINPGYVQSLFGMMRVFGAPLAVAYSVQFTGFALVVGVTCHAIVTGKPSALALGALIVAATLLATPFLLNYDLLISALPISWLVMSGMRDGFQPWEKAAIAGVLVLPLVARRLDTMLHLPLTPLVMLILFMMVLRRIKGQAVATAENSPAAFSSKSRGEAIEKVYSI